MGKFTFLRNETKGLRTQTTFIGQKCEIYLPATFLEGGHLAMANIVGNTVRTVGLFWFCVDGTEWHQFQLPIPTSFEFSSQEPKKHFAIKPGMRPMDYQVFTLNNGDAFIYDVNNKKDALQLKSFFQGVLEAGKIPANIPYEEIYDVLSNALKSTDFNAGLGVSAVAFEFLISELYRSASNTSQPMRLAYNGNNSFKYRPLRITALTRFGQFTSLIGEDIQTGLMSSIVRTRKKMKDIESPVEKILKY